MSVIKNKSAIAFILDDNVRGIRVEYEPDGPSEIVKTIDPSIIEGDFVVVQSTTRHHATVVKVTEVDVDPDMDNDSYHFHWIIQRIDMEAIAPLIAMEENAVTRVKQRERQKQREEARAALVGDDQDLADTLKLSGPTPIDAAPEPPVG